MDCPECTADMSTWDGRRCNVCGWEMDPAVRMFLDDIAAAVSKAQRSRVESHLRYKWQPHLKN